MKHLLLILIVQVLFASSAIAGGNAAAGKENRGISARASPLQPHGSGESWQPAPFIFHFFRAAFPAGKRKILVRSIPAL